MKWSHASVGFGESDYNQILKTKPEMESLISKGSAIMGRYDPNKRRWALAVDEWNSGLHPATAVRFFVDECATRTRKCTLLLC